VAPGQILDALCGNHRFIALRHALACSGFGAGQALGVRAAGGEHVRHEGRRMAVGEWSSLGIDATQETRCPKQHLRKSVRKQFERIRLGVRV